MRLYHVCSPNIGLPTIIPPGSFGRYVRSMRTGNLPDVQNARNLTWEVGLEIARLSLRPTAPSRLDCVFACPDLAAAEAFRHGFRKTGAIYAAELVDPNAPIHKADFALLQTNYAIGTAYVDFYTERCRRYWTDASSGLAEVLCGGAVRLIERLDPAP